MTIELTDDERRVIAAHTDGRPDGKRLATRAEITALAIALVRQHAAKVPRSSRIEPADIGATGGALRDRFEPLPASAIYHRMNEEQLVAARKLPATYAPVGFYGTDLVLEERDGPRQRIDVYGRIGTCRSGSFVLMRGQTR